MTAKTASGQQVFIDAGVKTQNGIIMDSNSEIHSGTATGGDITWRATRSCADWPASASDII